MVNKKRLEQEVESTSDVAAEIDEERLKSIFERGTRRYTGPKGQDRSALFHTNFLLDETDIYQLNQLLESAQALADRYSRSDHNTKILESWTKKIDNLRDSLHRYIHAPDISRGTSATQFVRNMRAIYKDFLGQGQRA